MVLLYDNLLLCRNYEDFFNNIHFWGINHEYGRILNYYMYSRRILVEIKLLI